MPSSLFFYRGFTQSIKNYILINSLFCRKSSMKVNSVYGLLLAVQSGVGLAAIPDYIAHNVNNITKVLPNETGKPTETHFVYPASLKTNARLIAFRNFIFSKVNEWKF